MKDQKDKKSRLKKPPGNFNPRTLAKSDALRAKLKSLPLEDRLLTMRLYLDLTQVELADKIGMSESYIAAIEGKKSRLTEEVAYRCSKAFGLPLECLQEKEPTHTHTRAKLTRFLKHYPTPGKRLERLRNVVLKISQKELGECLGIGAQEVSRLENDHKNFSRRTSHRISFLTGLPENYFDRSTYDQKPSTQISNAA